MYLFVLYFISFGCRNRINPIIIEGGGGGRGIQSQILKKKYQNICSYKNDAKFIILKNSRQRLLIICLILCSFISAHEHRFVKLIFIDRNTVIERS